MLIAAGAKPILGMNPVLGIVVLLAEVCAFFGLWSLIETTVVMLRVRAAVAQRPGWTWKLDASQMRSRRPGLLAGHVGNAKWRWLIAGRLPGGVEAEAFRIHSSVTTGKYSSKNFDSTSAIVVFPFPLPRASLTYDADAAYPEQPAWNLLRGDCPDPEAAAALFTPDVLAAARAGKYRWSFEGDAVVLTAPRRLRPAAMLDLVDHAVGLARSLPSSVLDRARVEVPQELLQSQWDAAGPHGHRGRRRGEQPEQG